MGAANPDFYQVHYKIGDNDNADPDSCSFDSLDTARTGQAKESAFMIRIQVINTNDTSGTFPFNLYYNDENNSGTAVPIGTDLDGTTQVNIAAGLPADGTATDVDDVVFDYTGTYTWSNGEYEESSADTDKYSLVSGYYTDIQYCIQFTSGAQNETAYYFFLRHNSDLFDGYNQVAQVTTAAAPAGGPRGPLGHPLHGPFKGPIT